MRGIIITKSFITTERSPTGNRSRFCEVNNFFVSAPSELKVGTVVEQALACTVLLIEKVQKSCYFLYTLSQKRFGSKFLNMLRIMILDTSYHAISSATLHNSVIMERTYLQ